jgi:hypothetical protein
MGGRARRRRSKYGLGLLIFFLVCLAVVAAALLWLYVALADYEKRTPKRALDGYFAMLAAGDYAGIGQDSGFLPDAMNSLDDRNAYLRQKFGAFWDGGLSYRQMESAELAAGQRLYSVYSGEDRLGEAMLTPREDGEGGWTVQPLLEYLPGYAVTAPEGAAVVVNALALSQEQTVGRHPVIISYMRDGAPVEVEIFQSMDDSSLAPQTVEYQTAPTLFEPQFSARAADGRQCEVTVDAEARTVSVSIPPDAEQHDAFAQRMELVARIYSDFITEDGPRSALRPYIHRGTSLYKNLSEYQIGWYIDHDARKFSDFSVSDIAIHSDGCFTGHIDFAVTVLRRGRAHVFNASYDMGFVQADGSWLLAGLHTRRTEAEAD